MDGLDTKDPTRGMWNDGRLCTEKSDIFLHNCGCFGGVKVSVVINLGMTPSSSDLHVDGMRRPATTLLEL